MSVSRLLITAGVMIALAGVLVGIAERFNLPLGRLPGDIVFRGKHTSFYFPVVTCLVLSVLGSLLLWLVNRR